MLNEIKKRVRLTIEQQLNITARYTAGETPDAIADSLGICANNVRGALLKHGVVARSRSEARTRFPHWKEAFDNITPEAAYWIGFLFADGSVSQSGAGSASLHVGLAARDRGHLEKLRTFLKSEHTICDKLVVLRGKTHPQVHYALRSTPVTDALRRHGMCNKSLDRVAPEHLINSRDFWRGMVDGDGFVNVDEDKKPKIGLYGGETIVTQFLEYLRRMGIARTTEVHRHSSSGVDDAVIRPGKIFKVELVCEPALAAAYLLYKDPCVALDRKFEPLKEIVASRSA